MKRLLLASILALTPAAVFAQECSSQTTPTCAEGSFSGGKSAV